MLPVKRLANKLHTWLMTSSFTNEEEILKRTEVSTNIDSNPDTIMMKTRMVGC